jgi:hypothetical protein
MLNMSLGYASREGILFCNKEICLYERLCLDKSSKHIKLSKPLSLNLSVIVIPIKGIINESKEDEDECVLKDKVKSRT